MQHLEKKLNIMQWYDPAVHLRIFKRFMLEHSLNAFIIDQEHGEYQYTTLEQQGVTAKLARFDMEIGFDHVCHQLPELITLLSELEHEPWMGTEEKQLVQQSIQLQVSLLQLFNWLESYGPKPLQDAEE